jgi:hypothetical protein
MHHVHVKRKEPHMNRYVIDEFHRNPAVLQALLSNARQERNRSLRAGLAWLRKRLTPRFDFRPSHWMERLG